MMSDWLDTIDWAELETAYGTAESIPLMLKRLTVSSKEEAISLLFDLGTTIFHQYSIYTATPYVLEYFLQLIPINSIPFRARLLEFLGEVAASIQPIRKNGYEPSIEIVACEQVLKAKLDLYFQLLQHENPSFRFCAAFLLTKLAEPESLQERFKSLLEAETDSLVKAGLIFALGDLPQQENLLLLLEPYTVSSSYLLQFAAIMTLARIQTPLPVSYIPFLSQAIINYQQVWTAFETNADKEDGLYHPIQSTLGMVKTDNIDRFLDSATFPWAQYKIKKSLIIKYLCKVELRSINLIQELHLTLLNEDSRYTFEDISYPILLYMLSETGQDKFDTAQISQRQFDYLRAIYDNAGLWGSNPNFIFKKLGLPERRNGWREFLGIPNPPIFSSDESEEILKRILRKQLRLPKESEIHNDDYNNIHRLELCQIANDTFVPHLYKLKELKELNLQGSEMTGDGVAALPIFPKLTELYLSGIPLTESAMRYISKLTTLKRLGLGTTGFRGEWLKYLISLNELEALFMGRNLEESNIAELKAHLPNCKIYT